MTDQRPELTTIPDWYLDTFNVVQHIEGALRNIEIELRGAMDRKSLDSRVRAEMQGVLDALHTTKGSLVLVDMIARNTLDQMLSDAA